MTQTQKLFVLPALMLLALVGGAALSYAQLSNAANENTNYGLGFGRGIMGGGMMGFRGYNYGGVRGEITGINGNTLTVKGVDGTTYTVRTNDAEVHTFVSGEGPQTVALNTLKVGDIIGVHGKVDGTSVDATDIMTGTLGKGIMNGFGRYGGRGVGGQVTAVEGNTITVKAPNGTSYTVDAKNASISRFVEGSVSDIHVGDRIGVQGTVDGNNIAAARIMDNMPERQWENE